MGQLCPTHQPACTPAPSVVSAMAGLREATASGVSPALAASMGAGGGGSTAGGGSQSLFKAGEGKNAQALAAVLGGPTDLASSRDEANDLVERELFVQK